MRKRENNITTENHNLFFAFMGFASSVGLSVWRSACASLRCGSRCFRIVQRKQIIRTYHRLEISSDYIGLVRMTGLEPARFRIGT